MGPCAPPSCGPTCSVEGGARALYTSNSAKLTVAGNDIDFVRDLNFSQNTLLGEVFVAGRLAPWGAFTYTFMIPREDRGNGVLTADLRVGNTLFPIGSQAAVKATLTVHRWEAEAYPVVGCNYRVGGLLLGELLVQHFRVETATAEDSKTYSRFLMGIGGVGEFAPASNIFGKLKAAWVFLDDQNGVYLDGEGKFFPDFGSGGCGAGGGVFSSCRPYVGAGYRWRYSEWSKNDYTLTTSIHGPYAELGVIF